MGGGSEEHDLVSPPTSSSRVDWRGSVPVYGRALGSPPKEEASEASTAVSLKRSQLRGAPTRDGGRRSPDTASLYFARLLIFSPLFQFRHTEPPPPRFVRRPCPLFFAPVAMH
ncbi:hypothetical protein MRX96_014905 [Rhipicephalus microplus]